MVWTRAVAGEMLGDIFMMQSCMHTYVRMMIYDVDRTVGWKETGKVRLFPKFDLKSCVDVGTIY